VKLNVPVLAVLGVLALVTSSSAQASEWKIDSAHSSAGFAVRHMMVSTVRGSFGAVQGTVHLDDADPTKSTVEATIDAKSINTGIDKRDDHLRSADFFDVEKFPTLTFQSTKIEPKEGGAYTVTGDLTMHGVTKPVTLAVEPVGPPVKDARGRMLRGASATGTLSRKDWGLTYNSTLEAGGVALSDEVKLQLDVELVLADPAKPAPAP
jgi:polyisoprenoid-binding protein YceI